MKWELRSVPEFTKLLMYRGFYENEEAYKNDCTEADLYLFAKWIGARLGTKRDLKVGEEYLFDISITSKENTAIFNFARWYINMVQASIGNFCGYEKFLEVIKCKDSEMNIREALDITPGEKYEIFSYVSGRFSAKPAEYVDITIPGIKLLNPLAKDKQYQIKVKIVDIRN